MFECLSTLVDDARVRCVERQKLITGMTQQYWREIFFFINEINYAPFSLMNFVDFDFALEWREISCFFVTPF